jgi:hypothetical protein
VESSRIVADAAASEAKKLINQPEAVAAEAVKAEAKEAEYADEGEDELPAEAVKGKNVEEELPAEAVMGEEEEEEEEYVYEMYEDDGNLQPEAALEEETRLAKVGSALPHEAVQGKV